MDSTKRTIVENTKDRRDKLFPEMRIGDYVVREDLASGGFGRIYLVEDTVKGRQAAMKVMYPVAGGMGELHVRILREARALKAIHHPNVVNVYDTGTLPDGRPYIVKELLCGMTLAAYLESKGRLNPMETLTILAPVGEALEAAHEHGIIHRNVKTSNVFLHQKDGPRRVVLLDFGLAKTQVDSEIALTRAWQELGTPASMAPEQIAGGKVDARTDVYALGVLAFHLVTGTLPFDHESGSLVQHMHIHAPRPRASSRANVSAAIDQVVLRAMAVNPEDRYPGLREFVSAFARAAAADRGGRRVAAGGPRTCQGIGVLLDVSTEPLAGARPDSAFLAACDKVLEEAPRVLQQHGFLVGLEAGSQLLLVRPLHDDATAALHERDEAVRTVLGLYHDLSSGPQRDDRVRFRFCIEVGTLDLDGDEVTGGELLQLCERSLDPGLCGVFGTAAALERLALGTQDVRDCEFKRVVDGPLADPAGSGDRPHPPSRGDARKLARLSRSMLGIISEFKSAHGGIHASLERLQAALNSGRPLEAVHKLADLEALMANAGRVSSMADDIIRLAATELRNFPTD